MTTEVTYEFQGDGSDFSALAEAEKWLRDHGFSVGSMQRGDPRGILFGDWDIAKWRNLSDQDKKELDGTMVGRRDTKAVVTLNKPVECYS